MAIQGTISETSQGICLNQSLVACVETFAMVHYNNDTY